MSWQDEFPHFAASLKYAEDVVAEKILACEYVKLSCQRQLDDLNREDFPFFFDAAAGERVCNFIETLPHIKGSQWRGLNITLEPWQSFGLSTAFGWKYLEDRIADDGKVLVRAGVRRFRTYYEEVPRKNAKSTKAAGVALYMVSEDDEPGAEVFSAATTRNQAKIVFSVAQEMARRATPSIDVRAHNLIHTDSASKFEALHAQGETMDGLNIHCSVNDEVHAWQKRSVYEVIQTATGAREQPLMFNITTAGVNVGGICYDLRGYLIKILKGVIEDDTFFGMIYTIDKDDDWTSPVSWQKANPNWGVSVSPVEVESVFKKAKEIPSQASVFKKYHLNQWASSAEDWMDMTKFMALYDPSLRIEDFADEPCWVGIDLASKRDVTSMCLLFRRELQGIDHLFAFMRHWLPEFAIENDPNNQYGGWVRAGALSSTPGNIIDVDLIEQATEDMGKEIRIQEIAVDPGHNSTQYGVHMAQKGFTVIDVRPNVMNFSEPMKWLEAYVVDGRFHYCCPVLSWMMSNVEVKPRGMMKDNLFPGKSADTRKIDGVIALLMALNRVKASEGTVDVYKDRELLIV